MYVCILNVTTQNNVFNKFIIIIYFFFYYLILSLKIIKNKIVVFFFEGARGHTFYLKGVHNQKKVKNPWYIIIYKCL